MDVIELAIVVCPAEVRRYLGYPPGQAPRPAARRCLEAIDAMTHRCAQLTRARGTYRVIDGADAAALGMPHPGARTGLAVCTIGADLEQLGLQLARENRLVEAMVVDAYGSAAAEAAADALEALVAAAVPPGLHAWPRASPGYAGWDVASQRMLFEHVAARALGIHLTAAAMMVPRKSVSFAVAFSSEPAGDALSRGCDACELTRCPHRKTGAGCAREDA